MCFPLSPTHWTPLVIAIQLHLIIDNLANLEKDNFKNDLFSLLIKSINITIKVSTQSLFINHQIQVEQFFINSFYNQHLLYYNNYKLIRIID